MTEMLEPAIEQRMNTGGAHPNEDTHILFGEDETAGVREEAVIDPHIQEDDEGDYVRGEQGKPEWQQMEGIGWALVSESSKVEQAHEALRDSEKAWQIDHTGRPKEEEGRTSFMAKAASDHHDEAEEEDWTEYRETGVYRVVGCPWVQGLFLCIGQTG